MLVAEHHGAGLMDAHTAWTGSIPDAEDLTQQVFWGSEAVGPVAESRRPEARSVAILRNRFLKDNRRPLPVPATTVGLDLDAMPLEAPVDGLADHDRLQEALVETPRLISASRVVMFHFEDCSYR